MKEIRFLGGATGAAYNLLISFLQRWVFFYSKTTFWSNTNAKLWPLGF